MAGGLSISPRALNVVAVTVLFVVALYLWTLPFQQNKLPFGEGDSAWHFAIGDKIASKDKATFRLPYYIGLWYYNYNRILGPFAPEYPPPSHVNYALMQIFGGERFVPVFIYRAVASFLGVFAVFFVISRLFGVLPGIVAGVGLSFSIREQLAFLFGQQPTLTSILIAPVTTYAWYKYLTSFYANGSSDVNNVNNDYGSKGGGKKIYILLTFALLASQYILHMQGFLISSVLMAIFTAMMVMRFRRLPVSRANIPHLAISAIILAALAAPFAAIYLGAPDTMVTKFSLNFDRLTEWSLSPNSVEGSYPAAFVQFSAEYKRVLLPFLFVGLGLLLLRLFLVKNNTKELFLLSWLIGAYIILHLDIFIGSSPSRIARMLVVENYIFFSLIGVSVVWLPQTISSLIKLDKQVVNVAKYALAAVLLFALISSGWGRTYSTMKSAYGGLERITPLQAEFAANYLSSLPEKAFIYDVTPPNIGGFAYTVWRYPKLRWALAISQRHLGREPPEAVSAAGKLIADKDAVYALFDYSDLAVLASSSDQGTQQLGIALANELRKTELQMFNNTLPLYDSSNIRLYKYHYAGNFTGAGAVLT